MSTFYLSQTVTLTTLVITTAIFAAIGFFYSKGKISTSSYLYTDKVFRAVIAANQEAANQEEGYKYHLVGGAAGTVSPSKRVLLLMILILHHHISSCSL